MLCFDLNFLPLVEKLLPQLPSVEHYVLMTDRAHMPASSAIPNLLCYEELVDAEDGDYQWPQFDERTASSICYTSGTTGHPKGAVYSHRSTLLHSYGLSMPDAMGVGGRDVILPVVPMFHVNAWGVPYAAAMIGAKLVFPGPHLDGKSLYELMEGERVTFSAGVPTVWLGLITHAKQNGLAFSTLRRTVIGGSACPPAMMRTLRGRFRCRGDPCLGHDRDVAARHAVAIEGTSTKALDAEARHRILEKQGKVIFGVDMAIVDDDGTRTAVERHRFGQPGGARAVGDPAATSSARSRR